MGKKASMDKRKLLSSGLSVDLEKRTITKCFFWSAALNASDRQRDKSAVLYLKETLHTVYPLIPAL